MSCIYSGRHMFSAMKWSLSYVNGVEASCRCQAMRRGHAWLISSKIEGQWGMRPMKL